MKIGIKAILFTLLTLVYINVVYPFSLHMVTAPKRILVTGAGIKGTVGYHVFRKLLKNNKLFYPIGLVKGKGEKKVLEKLGASSDQMIVADITQKNTLSGKFHNIDKVVLCQHAIAKKRLFYYIKKFVTIFKSIFNSFISFFDRQDRTSSSHVYPTKNDIYFESKQTPYEIDYLGNKNVIDECVDAKVEQIVLLGSMGGYRSINKSSETYKWKRAIERYLMKRSFFTIIHAAILTDEPGGKREIIWDVDDLLLFNNFKRIPKSDAAEVIVQALLWKEAIGRSIDVATRAEGTGPSKDWLRFWSRPGDCTYPAVDE